MNENKDIYEYLNTNGYKLNDWQKQILVLLADGMSNRAIATKVFGDTYYEYKVRSFLKKIEMEVDDVTFPASNKKVLSESVESILHKENVNILYFDIETSPCLSYHFNHWDVSIRQEHKVKESHLLTVSWAFNDEPVQGFKLNPSDIKDGDDLTLVVNMMEAIEKADIMVGYNSKKFDIKYLNTRAIFYGIPPVTTTKHIDLYEQVKKSFKFPSNSMGNVSNYLGLEGKLETEGWSLWRRCMEYWNIPECEKALDDMLKYNKQDIEATRDLHKRMMGWLKQTPNIGAIKNIKSGVNTMRCAKCSSDDVVALNKLTFTNVKGWEMYRCNSCGGVSRYSTNGLVGCPVS